jgi:hypothetical protein
VSYSSAAQGVSYSSAAEEVSQCLEAERLSLRQCVSESSVSVRNQKSTVLAVNYRRRKPVFRRVAVISPVRSFSVYLVELLPQQSIIVICVVINRHSE